MHKWIGWAALVIVVAAVVSRTRATESPRHRLSRKVAGVNPAPDPVNTSDRPTSGPNVSEEFLRERFPAEIEKDPGSPDSRGTPPSSIRCITHRIQVGADPLKELARMLLLNPDQEECARQFILGQMTYEQRTRYASLPMEHGIKQPCESPFDRLRTGLALSPEQWEVIQAFLLAQLDQDQRHRLEESSSVDLGGDCELVELRL